MNWVVNPGGLTNYLPPLSCPCNQSRRCPLPLLLRSRSRHHLRRRLHRSHCSLRRRHSVVPPAASSPPPAVPRVRRKYFHRRRARARRAAAVINPRSCTLVIHAVPLHRAALAASSGLRFRQKIRCFVCCCIASCLHLLPVGSCVTRTVFSSQSHVALQRRRRVFCAVCAFTRSQSPRSGCIRLCLDH